MGSEENGLDTIAMAVPESSSPWTQPEIGSSSFTALQSVNSILSYEENGGIGSVEIPTSWGRDIASIAKASALSARCSRYEHIAWCIFISTITS